MELTEKIRKTIFSFTDAEAGWVWIFMLSLQEEGYAINKMAVRKHLKLSERNFGRIMSFLNREGFIAYMQEREKGKIIKSHVIVFEGSTLE